jgi:hypothetical protein
MTNPGYKKCHSCTRDIPLACWQCAHCNASQRRKRRIQDDNLETSPVQVARLTGIRATALRSPQRLRSGRAIVQASARAVLDTVVSQMQQEDSTPSDEEGSPYQPESPVSPVSTVSPCNSICGSGCVGLAGSRWPSSASGFLGLLGQTEDLPVYPRIPRSSAVRLHAK